MYFLLPHHVGNIVIRRMCGLTRDKERNTINRNYIKNFFCGKDSEVLRLNNIIGPLLLNEKDCKISNQKQTSIQSL